MIDALRDDAAVTIVRQTAELFGAGLNLYRRRPDKGYSLTDCMSMIVCQQFDVTDVLTHDQHFAQESFTLLL
jgi:predicted nucleic acid-binding protein